MALEVDKDVIATPGAIARLVFSFRGGGVWIQE